MELTESSETFVLILNPRAGGGRALRQRSALERTLKGLGARFDTRMTEGPGHATTLVREALRGGAAGVAVVGGDGSFNEAVNGFVDEAGDLISPDAWLAPLPCGTGGDFRRTLRIPTNLQHAAARMLNTEAQAHDFGWMTFENHAGETSRRAFINIASFGMAGEIDLLVNDSPKWMGGRLSFFWGSLQAMRTFEAPVVRLSVDGEAAYERPITNVAVANGRYFGGGMKIAPTADTQDGALDIVTVGPLSVARQLALTPFIYGPGVLGRPGIDHCRARELRAEPVDPDTRVVLDVDGETPGYLPATFQVRPGAIRIRG